MFFLKTHVTIFIIINRKYDYGKFFFERSHQKNYLLDKISLLIYILPLKSLKLFFYILNITNFKHMCE